MYPWFYQAQVGLLSRKTTAMQSTVSEETQESLWGAGGILSAARSTFRLLLMSFFQRYQLERYGSVMLLKLLCTVCQHLVTVLWNRANNTQTSDLAVLLPEGFWHKLNWKMSFNEPWRGGEVFCHVNSCKKIRDRLSQSLILMCGSCFLTSTR